ITDAKNGVDDFEFTSDGKWLIYSAGKAGERQLWSLEVGELTGGEAKPKQLTKLETAVTDWQLVEDGSAVLFRSPDTVDADEKARMEKKFDVRIRNQDQPLQQLWRLDLATGESRRL